MSILPLLLFFILALPGRAEKCPEQFEAAVSSEAPADPVALKQKIFDQSRKIPLTLAVQGGKYLISPVSVPMKLLEAAETGVKQKSFRSAAVKFIREDGLVATGLVGTYAYYGAAPATVATYFLLPGNQASGYQKQLDDQARDDGITIYVDGIPNDNGLAGFGEADFNRRFGAQKNAFLIRPHSLSDMFSEIKRLAEKSGKPIARLEILGHGLPGTIDIRGESLDEKTAAMFSPLKADFAPNAEIRFFSCLLGANVFPSKPGESLMQKVGEQAFEKGGSVFASNHVIWVDLPFEKKNRKTIFERAVDGILSPLNGGVMAGIEAGKLLGGTTEPYRRINFPARAPAQAEK